MFNHMSIKQMETRIDALIFDSQGSYYGLDTSQDLELETLIAELLDRTTFILINECDLCANNNDCPNIPF